MPAVTRGRRGVAVVASALLLWSGVVASAGDGHAGIGALTACIQDNFPSESAQHRVTLITLDRDGGRQRLQARVFWQPSRARQNRFHVRLDEPADLAGSAYLMIQDPAQDSLYVYVPGLNRVRRMRGEAMTGELWGTSINYNDFQYLYGIAVDANFSVVDRIRIGARDAHVLAARIPPAGGWGYSEVRVSVDDERCVVLGADYLDAEGEVRKRLVVDPASLVQIDGYWTPQRVVVEDFATQRRTELVLEQAAYDQPLSRGLFESASFHSVRPPSLEP